MICRFCHVILISILTILEGSFADFVQELPLAKVVLVSSATPDEVILLNDIPNSDMRLSFSLPLQPNETVRMECSASYPIEWTYEGYGTPNLGIENSIELLKLDANQIENSTFTYQTTVIFSNLTEGNTGKYTCGGINPNENAGVYFHVYTLGESTFVFPKNKYYVDASEEDYGYVPCVITDPLLRNVTLYKGEEESKEELNAYQYLYDAVYGFRLNWTIFENPQDLYTCVSVSNFDEDEETAETHSVEFRAVKPIVAGDYKVLPPENFVPHNELPEQAIFACHSKSEIVIKVNFNEDPSILPPEGMIRYDSEETEDFPFTGKATITTANYTNTFITIQCVNKGDGRILHFWEFSPFGVNHIDEFQQKNYVFSCCTTSFHTPILKRMTCDSSHSCDIMRKKTLSYLIPEENIDIEIDPNTGKKCLMWTLNSTVDEFGLLQCSLSLQYLEMELNSSREIMYSYSKFKNMPPTLIEMDELTVPSIEKILVVQKLSTSDIIGVESEFLCEANSLFFSRGLQWGIKFENGTTQVVPKEQVVGNDENNPTVITRQSRFVVYSLDVKSVYCTAPLWNSIQWLNSSVEVEMSNDAAFIASNMNIIFLITLCFRLILNISNLTV